MVATRSQADSAIFARDMAAFTMILYEVVNVVWEISQTVSTASEPFTLLITNISNATTEYDLAVNGIGLTALPGLARISLSSRAMGIHLVTVAAAVTGALFLYRHGHLYHKRRERQRQCRPHADRAS